MKDLLDFGLLLAGWCLVVLCIASFWIPKALQWKEKLAVLSPLMREMFLTYALYILGSHICFAVLTLGHRDWLLGGSSSATVMSGFMLLWWLVRLLVQFFGFDFEEVADTPANRLAKHALTFLFVSLVTIFGLTLWWNLGGRL